jgi:hypothetical protein
LSRTMTLPQAMRWRSLGSVTSLAGVISVARTGMPVLDASQFSLAKSNILLAILKIGKTLYLVKN